MLLKVNEQGEPAPEITLDVYLKRISEILFIAVKKPRSARIESDDDAEPFEHEQYEDGPSMDGVPETPDTTVNDSLSTRIIQQFKFHVTVKVCARLSYVHANTRVKHVTNNAIKLLVVLINVKMLKAKMK